MTDTDTDTDPETPPELRTIYCVLAGRFEDPQVRRYMAQLDWLAVLGLHAWYKCPPTATLAEVLDEFDKTAAAVRGNCLPLPPWSRFNGDSDCNSTESGTNNPMKTEEELSHERARE